MSAAASLWLPLPFLAYAGACLYFARLAFVENGNHDRFFSAGHDIAPWISALLLAGASLSGWFVLGGAQQIAAGGFSLPVLLIGGIALALPGVILFKRIWLSGKRLGASSDAELLRRYYGSDALVAMSAAVAVLIAIGFCGLQMRALGRLTVELTGGAVSAPVALAVMAALLLSYVTIGGLRAVAYIGAVQSVLMAAATIVLAGLVLVWLGGFGPLNAALKTLAADPAAQSRFLVAGVLDFSAGLGRDATGFEPTAMANLGVFLALMGIQASPLALKIVLATRSPAGIAAGQTWVMAGAFGALLAFCVPTLGAAALVDPSLSLSSLLGRLADGSPWLAGWLFVGLLCGAQLLAGLGLLVAAEHLVRHLYKPLLHGDLDRRATVNLARVAAALLAVAGVLLQALAPVALSALAGVALPLAVQMLVPLAGIAWFGRLTREGAVVGASTGFLAVLLTEPLGHAVLSFLGLELPWGRWPWTLNSAVWGLAANVAAAFLVSVATRRRSPSEAALRLRRFLASTAPARSGRGGLRATAWAVTLAWLFLAAGPGLLFGNSAFGAPGSEHPFMLGIPSLWAWSVLFWMLGVGLVWFLSYRMRLAAGVSADVQEEIAPPRLNRHARNAERQRLHRFAVAAAAIFGLTVLAVFAFG